MPYPANSGAHLALTFVLVSNLNKAMKQKYKEYGPTLSNSVTTKHLPELHPNSSLQLIVLMSFGACTTRF
jgi:hypothetical protein